jgi:ketosteroid isomerase-like protein
MDRLVSLELIDAQEERFARAFAGRDISQTRDLYQPDVVYQSPTTRLFGGARTIEGVDATVDFVQLTISGCHNIAYRLDERAVLPDGTSAYTRIIFDWDAGDDRFRSVYVVLYRYLEGLIARQELYYDPGAQPEVLGPVASRSKG